MRASKAHFVLPQAAPSAFNKICAAPFDYAQGRLHGARLVVVASQGLRAWAKLSYVALPELH